MPQSRRVGLRSQRRSLPALELLEARELLSASKIGSALFQPTGKLLGMQPAAGLGSAVYTPAQIRTAYGLNNITNQGQGMTIAIVDAYGDPNITTDLAIFSSQFGLPQMNGVGGNPTFQIKIPTGQVSNPPLPGNPWPGEISLDVEWVHAIAPRANIILVVTQDNSGDALFAAEADGLPYASGVGYAKSLPGVVVVSNSYGGGEFVGESFYDGSFVQPNVAVTFSTGDNGAPGGYPAFSPNVVAVGGTSLNTIGARGAYGVESGWSGSGGGVSIDEPTPAYQSNNGVNFGARATPDISLVADPNTGVLVIDQFDVPGFFLVFGGTSLSSPLMAGIVAIADQGRIAGGKQALDSQGVLQTIYGTYNSANYAANFHDVTTGNNGFAAGVGYDLVTGVGTPKANVFINTLVGATPAAIVAAGGASFSFGSAGMGSNNAQSGVTPVVNPVGTSAGNAAAGQLAASPATAIAMHAGLPLNVAMVALPSQSRLVRIDTATDVGALPAGVATTAEGYRSLTDGISAQPELLFVPGEFGLPEFSDDAATPVSVPAATEALPATLTGNVSDAVFTDFTVTPAAGHEVAPVGVLAVEDNQAIDLAMVAGLALALGGSWSGMGRNEEQRKVPALRN